jgi:transcriptional regulator with XRE-family HTH domain
MGRKTYSPDGTEKLCTGMLHREGVMLPLYRFHILKSGRNAGKPMPECSDCWRKRQGTKQRISIVTIRPMIDRLVEELGSNDAVCKRIGVPRNAISRLHHQVHVNGKLVEKLQALDAEIQKDKDEAWMKTMEPEVVNPEPIGSVLREFCKQWIVDRPYGENYLGPQNYIAIHSGISIRQISRICNSETKFVSLSKADAILSAIDQQELLRNGEIKIIPNPTWSMESYMRWMKERGCI